MNKMVYILGACLVSAHVMIASTYQDPQTKKPVQSEPERLAARRARDQDLSELNRLMRAGLVVAVADCLELEAAPYVAPTNVFAQTKSQKNIHD